MKHIIIAIIVLNSLTLYTFSAYATDYAILIDGREEISLNGDDKGGALNTFNEWCQDLDEVKYDGDYHCKGILNNKKTRFDLIEYK